MAEKTTIAWCDHTFNGWIGCTRVGPGCDHCYAEALDKRHRWGGGTHWGAGVPRYRTSEANWKEPIRWNSNAGAAGVRPRVFCASLADVFDNEVPAQWRVDLWALIDATPNLSWLIVTKRVGLVRPWIELHGWPANARLLITVCDQEEADRDIPKLLALPCKNGVSYEPALGLIDWSRWLLYTTIFKDGFPNGVGTPLKRLEWIIVGGESTQGSGKARPFDLAWARNTVAQCKTAGVPVFVKQLGSHPITDVQQRPGWGGKLFSAFKIKFNDRAGADPAEWPSDLRIQEFPREVFPAAHAAAT